MKDLIKNNWLVTIVAAIVAIAIVFIVVFCVRAGWDSTAIVALVGGLVFAVGKLFHVMPPPGAAALLMVLGVETLLPACTPAQRSSIPVISTIDAVGMGIARVAHWCDDAGADAETLERAKAAAREKDYAQAIALLSDMATSLRATGHDIPDDAFVTLKLVEGALAAEAIQNGMRALSSPREPETEPSEPAPTH